LLLLAIIPYFAPLPFAAWALEAAGFAKPPFAAAALLAAAAFKALAFVAKSREAEDFDWAAPTFAGLECADFEFVDFAWTAFEPAVVTRAAVLAVFGFAVFLALGGGAFTCAARPEALDLSCPADLRSVVPEDAERGAARAALLACRLAPAEALLVALVLF
jgi:hypothetical protein